jgi:hypothetical protein
MGVAKEACETLMNAVLPFAVKCLSENGEFYPYGGVIRSSGEIAFEAAYDGEDHPPSLDLIKLLRAAFIEQAGRGKLLATAVVYDVTTTLPSSGQRSDAIAIDLDHRDNYSVTVYLPYELADAAPQFGEAFAKEGDFAVFRAI